MISWLVSKNNTRLTSCDELISVLSQNKDLLYKEGTTNIGGINLYHFKNDEGEAQFSYGSVTLTIASVARSIGRVSIGISSISTKVKDLLECIIKDESVVIPVKGNGTEDIPLSAFESETDFFQYTVLNLNYKCSDASLIKLIQFITEFLDEQPK